MTHPEHHASGHTFSAPCTRSHIQSAIHQITRSERRASRDCCNDVHTHELLAAANSNDTSVLRLFSCTSMNMCALRGAALPHYPTCVGPCPTCVGPCPTCVGPCPTCVGPCPTCVGPCPTCAGPCPTCAGPWNRFGRYVNGLGGSCIAPRRPRSCSSTALPAMPRACCLGERGMVPAAGSARESVPWPRCMHSSTTAA
eukprot:365965-Chlamydomonas_euryale.AAC.16